MTLQVKQIELVPGEPDTEAWIEVPNRANRATWGAAGQQVTSTEIVEVISRRPQHRQTYLATNDDGVAVGALQTIRNLSENVETGGLWLTVDPAHQRRGIGRELLRLAEVQLRTQGCTRIHEHSGSPVESGGAATAFAVAHGYRQTQLDLRQDLALPMADHTMSELAAQASPAAYQLLVAVDVLPEDWLEDRAYLARRMSTDAPMGDIDLDEEEWDAERVRRQCVAVEGGHRFETVAREVATGRLVGFTEISVYPASPHLAIQHDTLVLREHRGHGLGLAMKLANLAVLQREAPAVTTVRTWNAETNGPMLAVNRRMGFQVSGWTREWAKDL